MQVTIDCCASDIDLPWMATQLPAKALLAVHEHPDQV